MEEILFKNKRNNLKSGKYILKNSTGSNILDKFLALDDEDPIEPIQLVSSSYRDVFQEKDTKDTVNSKTAQKIQRKSIRKYSPLKAYARYEKHEDPIKEQRAKNIEDTFNIKDDEPSEDEEDENELFQYSEKFDTPKTSHTKLKNSEKTVYVIKPPVTDPVKKKEEKSLRLYNDDDKIERILKLVETDYTSTNHPLVLRASSPDDKVKFANYFEKCNYLVYIILISTFGLLTTLKATNAILTKSKTYFDKLLINFWNWARNSFMKSSTDNEVYIATCILMIPMIIVLLILYAGFSILFIINKILLLRVPNSFTNHLLAWTS